MFPIAHDQDVENPFKTNEPRLEVEESVSSSPAAEEGPEGHNNSLVYESASVKKALGRSLELRKELKFLQAASKESSLKKIMEGDECLREWSQIVIYNKSDLRTPPVKSRAEHSDYQNVLHCFAKTNTKHLLEEIAEAS